MGVHLAGAGQARDRHVQTFLVDLPAIRPKAAPTDIDDMAGTGEQSDQTIVVEGRCHDREIVQVAGPLPRIVGDENIAFAHRVDGEFLKEKPDTGGHRVDMTRGAGDRLGEHPPSGVENPGGQVASLAGGSAERGADQGLGLFLDHRDQAVPLDLHVNTVKAVGGGHGERSSLTIAGAGADSHARRHGR